MQNQPDKIGLSIIIATFNRFERIRHLIRHFDLEMIIPKSLVLELVVVDNNSTDDTALVVQNEGGKKRNYKINYILEKRQGLSFARNTGISVAEQDWVFFLDDDALPAVDFLDKLLLELKDKQSVSAFCCKVSTHFLNVPRWFPLSGRYKLPMMGNYNLGNQSRFLDINDPPPIGSGIILRKSIFQKYGYFDTRFGYNQRKIMLIPGEETHLVLTILNAGESFYYIHNCLINHFPDRIRLSIRTLSRIFMGQGYLFGIQDYEKREQNSGGYLFRIPTWYYKEIISTFIRSIYCLIKGDQSGFYYYYLHFLKIIGRYWGYFDA